MADSIRAFIAVELPQALTVDIQKLQDKLKKQRLHLRWVRPQNIHLTLKFLGNIDAKDVADITKSLGQAVQPHRAFALAPQGLGIFPNLKNPKVVWIGVSGDTAKLRELQRSIDDALHLLGFAKEKRPFRGHLTIGRVKERIDSRKIAETLKSCGLFTSDPFKVDRLALIKSDLRPQGPIYTRLENVLLMNSE
jgi:2'-5' RNA ligase